MTSILLLNAAVTLAAPALKDPPGADASIVGEWVLESTTLAGRLRPYSGNPLRYVFTADGKWLTYRGDELESNNHGFTTDPKARPWRIDLRTEPRPIETPRRGIYKIEGNTLTLCMARQAGDPRPTQFAAPRGSDTMLYIFKRVKKD